jgi:hypothetical protein
MLPKDSALRSLQNLGCICHFSFHNSAFFIIPVSRDSVVLDPR